MAGKKITMSLSETTLRMLDEVSEKKGMKKSAIIALLVEEYYRQQKGVSNEGK